MRNINYINIKLCEILYSFIYLFRVTLIQCVNEIHTHTLYSQFAELMNVSTYQQRLS